MTWVSKFLFFLKISFTHNLESDDVFFGILDVRNFNFFVVELSCIIKLFVVSCVMYSNQDRDIFLVICFGLKFIAMNLYQLCPFYLTFLCSKNNNKRRPFENPSITLGPSS